MKQKETLDSLGVSLTPCCLPREHHELLYEARRHLKARGNMLSSLSGLRAVNGVTSSAAAATGLPTAGFQPQETVFLGEDGSERGGGVLESHAGRWVERRATEPMLTLSHGRQR